MEWLHHVSHFFGGAFLAKAVPRLVSGVLGWVADRFGPRWTLGIGAASGFAAALVGILYLIKRRPTE